MDFLTFLLTTTFLNTATLAENCPSEMLPMQDACLEWNNGEPLDFSTAEEQCIKKGGSLAGEKSNGLGFPANLRHASYGPFAEHYCYWIDGDLQVLKADTIFLGGFLDSIFGEKPKMCPQACLESNVWWSGFEQCIFHQPYICTYDPEIFQASVRETENTTTSDPESLQPTTGMNNFTATQIVERTPAFDRETGDRSTQDTPASSKKTESTQTTGISKMRRPKESMQELEFVQERKNSCVLGSALQDAPVAVVTMCFRLCRDTSECAVFNYNPVEKWCRTFPREAEDSTNHESCPDWQIWVGK